MKRSSRVLIYEPNELNPLGRELARLLGEFLPVTFYFSGRSWVPAGVASRAVLARGRQDVGLRRHLIRRFLGPFRPALRAVVRREVLLVVWCKGIWDALIFTMASALGAPAVVINHNPCSLRPRTQLRDRAHRLLLRRAQLSVVLDESIRVAAMEESDRVLTCTHPSFAGWREQLEGATAAPDRGVVPARILVLGALRRDKGCDEIPLVMEHVKRPVALVVAGPTPPSQEWCDRLHAVGTTIEGATTTYPLTDEELAECIASCDLMIAPYVAATQSSSVILAMTCNLPVLGYASGALRSLLTPASRVRVGDAPALGELVTRFLSRPWPTYAITPAELDIAARLEWERALDYTNS